MKKLKGSLTVEASIVLPLFLMAILSIVYLIKIIYIHESVQYAINETANEMATYAYIMEKTEILNAEQEIYHNAIANVNGLNNNVGTIINNMEILYETIEGANSIISSQDTYDSSNFIDIVPNNGNLSDYIKNYMDNIKEIQEKIVNSAGTAYNSLNEIIHSIDIVLKSIEGTLINDCLVEGLEVTNNYVGTKIAELMLNKHISDEQYKKWYILDGKDGMDFRHSKFMLENEDIDLVVSYKLAIPIPFPGLKEISMMQRVKVRSWTGNGYTGTASPGNDHDTSDGNNNENTDHSEDIIVYLVKNRQVYHLDETCVKKKTTKTTYSEINDRGLDPCDFCCKGLNNFNDSLTVYYTDYGEVFHIASKCTRIYSETEEVTLDEAIKRGRRACQTKKCKEKMKRIEEK